MITIEEQTRQKIFQTAEALAPSEVGGLLLGEIDQFGNIDITDQIILKQKKTPVAFCIDEEDMMRFTKEAEPQILQSVIGWWHSHGYGTTFWSMDDDQTFQRLAKFMDGFCVGVVVSANTKRKDRERWRSFFHTKTGNIISLDDLNIKVWNNQDYNYTGLTPEEREYLASMVTEGNPQDIEVDWHKECGECGQPVLLERPIPRKKEKKGKSKTGKSKFMRMLYGG